jgi:hypothetical protein
MKINSKVKAGLLTANHNQTRRIRIKSGIKTGLLTANHNQN